MLDEKYRFLPHNASPFIGKFDSFNWSVAACIARRNPNAGYHLKCLEHNIHIVY